jgi:hypothetical protein
MKDTPFNLETLVDVPRTVEGGSFLTKLYDKSGCLVFRPKDRYQTVLNLFNIQSFIKLSKRIREERYLYSQLD